MQSHHNIVQLSRGHGPAIHTYYDIIIEEPPGGGDRIIYFEFETDQIPGPGHVIVANHDGSDPQQVGRAEDAIGHIGGKACWLSPNRIAWSPDPTKKDSAVALDLATGQQEELPGSIRSVNHFAARAILMGGGGDAAVTRAEEVQRMRRLDLKTGEVTDLFNVEQAHAIHPRRDEFDPAFTTFQNPKWSPDGSELFVVFGTGDAPPEIANPDMPRIKCMIRLNADGSNPRCIGEFGDHPMWSPDGKFIFSNFKNDHGGKDVRMFPNGEAGEPITLVQDLQGGHPSISPDGRWLVSEDAPPSDEFSVALVMCDLEQNERHLIMAAHHCDGHHITGTHIHPQWSRDGSRIFFNSSDSGQPQFYAALL